MIFSRSLPAALLLVSFTLPLTQPSRAQTPVPATTVPAKPIAPLAPTKPPVAKVEPVTETYFGTKITDPYRYMENLQDPYVQNWLKQEATYSRNVLEHIPGRQELLNSLRAAITVPSSTAKKPAGSADDFRDKIPWQYRHRGNYYFFAAGDELRYRTSLSTPSKSLVSADVVGGGTKETHYTINHYIPSPDGSAVVFGISANGSEESTIHVVSTASGKVTTDVIDRTQSHNDGNSAFGDLSVSWRADNKSFFYNRFPKLPARTPDTEKQKNSVVYLHILGSDSDQDKPVLGAMLSLKAIIAPADIPFVYSFSNCHYVLGMVLHGDLNDRTIYAAPLAAIGDNPDAATIPWVKVCDVPDAVVDFKVHGDTVYLMTHKNAGRFKIVKVALSGTVPDLTKAAVVVPPGDPVITGINTAQDALYVSFRENMAGRLRRVDYETNKSTAIPLPLSGTLQVSTSDTAPGALLSLRGWTFADTLFQYDPAANRLEKRADLASVIPAANAPDLTSEEVLVRAKDGTGIPLSIVYRRGLKRDGTNPCWLTGYGGFGIPTDPYFTGFLDALWFKRGGIYAFAHVRGGGELGEAWHIAGMLKNKPNTWNDFIACAEYLIRNKYTTPARLAGQGVSAGGTLIGRAITERPNLFRVALIGVGVLNTLRREFSANGVPNIPELGTVTTPEGFEAVREEDSVLHVRDGVKYPAVLLTTGLNDPRVSPWEPAKMTARLQAASASHRPVLLSVDYSGGHSSGDTTDQVVFMLWQMGLLKPEPPPGGTTSH